MRERVTVIAGAAVAAFGLFATVAPAQPPNPLPQPSVVPPPPATEMAPPPRLRPGPPPGHQNVYRLVGNYAPDHVYTTDPNEARRLSLEGTYRQEGVGFYVLD